MGIDIIVYGIVVFIYGVVLGSFYNVVIYRVPRDISIAKGRSICPSCNTTLKAIDLIPIFSQLFLRNKCRYCKNKISMIYPVIEIATGCLFFLSFYLFGLQPKMFLMICFWSMLLITGMIDFSTMLIADSILIFFTALGVVFLYLSKVSVVDHLLGAAVGFGAFFAIYIIAKIIYKREAFGFGDVLLMSSIGVFLGFRNTIITALCSFYVALFFIIVMKVLGKKIKIKQEVPFGPYMCIAAFIASIYGDQMYQYYMSFF